MYQAGAHVGGYGNMLSPHTLVVSPYYRDPFEYKYDMRDMNKCGGGGIA